MELNQNQHTLAISEHTDPIVSVIVPVYNQADYLSEALASVHSQTYRHWECIVINDGSTDNSEAIAKSWCAKDSRFQYISSANLGVSHARNLGIRQAKGTFILPLDGDDKIGEEYLRLGMVAFEADPTLTLVYCNAEKFGLETGHWDLPDYDFRALLLYNIIFNAALFRKEDWAKSGGYDEALKRGWEDWSFWVKLLQPDSKVYRIPGHLFYYRIKAVSKNAVILDQDKMDVRWFIFRSQMDKYRQLFADPIYYFGAYDEMWRQIQELEQQKRLLETELSRIMTCCGKD